MRDFKITRNEGELYEVKVVDSYGKKYKNWLKNANDLKFEINILNLFRKLVWKTFDTYKRVKNRYL